MTVLLAHLLIHICIFYIFFRICFVCCSVCFSFSHNLSLLLLLSTITSMPLFSYVSLVMFTILYIRKRILFFYFINHYCHHLIELFMSVFDIFAVNIPSKVLWGILFVLPSIIFAVRIPSKALWGIFMTTFWRLIIHINRYIFYLL